MSYDGSYQRIGGLLGNLLRLKTQRQYPHALQFDDKSTVAIPGAYNTIQILANAHLRLYTVLRSRVFLLLTTY